MVPDSVILVPTEHCKDHVVVEPSVSTSTEPLVTEANSGQLTLNAKKRKKLFHFISTEF
jgi:hypothetical protein